MIAPKHLAIWLFLLAFRDATLEPALAAPIHLRFQAAITEIQGDPSELDLPFALELGDRLSGLFKFESEDYLRGLLGQVPAINGQGQLELSVGGVVSTTRINVGFNNLLTYLPASGIRSSIFLGYTSPTDVYPGWGGQGPVYPWGAELILVDSSETLNPPNGDFDFDAWNRPTVMGNLRMFFGSPNSATISVTASAGTFLQVPEATSGSLMFVFFTIAFSGGQIVARKNSIKGRRCPMPDAKIGC